MYNKSNRNNMNVDRTVGYVYEREANASVRFIKEGAERIWQIFYQYLI